MSFLNLFGGESRESYQQTFTSTINAEKAGDVDAVVAAGGAKGSVLTLGYAPTTTNILTDKSKVVYQGAGGASVPMPAPWETTEDGKPWYQKPATVLKYALILLATAAATFYILRRRR